jgi:MFS transporter, MCT family, solute carrier family 16 (monocarboxylic acid transporters), member 3
MSGNRNRSGEAAGLGASTNANSDGLFVDTAGANRDGNDVDEKGTSSGPAQRTISNVEAPIPHVEVDTAFAPPDRGWRAWSQVVAALCINCLVWGFPTAFGVFQLHYVETMGLPAAQVSWIGSIQLFLTFVLSTLSGRLSDAGYVREGMGLGSLLILLGTFATSLGSRYWHFVLAQGVCTGIGMGISFMPAISVVSSYFKRNRAFALAVSATGTSVGSVLFPCTVQYLIPQVGFPWAVRCAGFVALVILATANILIRPYLPPRKSGPPVELAAFKEIQYAFFALAAFLQHYAQFFGFFYVSR